VNIDIADCRLQIADWNCRLGLQIGRNPLRNLQSIWNLQSALCNLNQETVTRSQQLGLLILLIALVIYVFIRVG